jgi:hypothetical protein
MKHFSLKDFSDFLPISKSRRQPSLDPSQTLPDLRIECETRQDQMARVDLELTTQHYRPRQLAKRLAPACRSTSREARQIVCDGSSTSAN